MTGRRRSAAEVIEAIKDGSRYQQGVKRTRLERERGGKRKIVCRLEDSSKFDLDFRNLCKF